MVLRSGLSFVLSVRRVIFSGLKLYLSLKISAIVFASFTELFEEPQFLSSYCSMPIINAWLVPISGGMFSVWANRFSLARVVNKRLMRKEDTNRNIFEVLINLYLKSGCDLINLKKPGEMNNKLWFIGFIFLTVKNHLCF